jgi:elongation factor Tu
MTRDDVERGMVIAKPGSITPHTRFMSEVVRAEEGRRRAAQGILQRLPPAVLHPHDGCDRQHQAAGRGRNGNAWRQREPGSELIVPVALEQGSKFAIREGGLTVGAGVITKIIE